MNPLTVDVVDEYQNIVMKFESYTAICAHVGVGIDRGVRWLKRRRVLTEAELDEFMKLPFQPPNHTNAKYNAKKK